MMSTSYHKLYGMSKSKDPTTITTLCLYKPNKHKKLKLHEDYDLDTYLNTYVSQHTLTRQIPEIKPRLQLPPPRTPPIRIPTTKSSDNNSHTSYQQPPALHPIQEQDTINEDQVEESSLDPSLDCITLSVNAIYLSFGSPFRQTLNFLKVSFIAFSLFIFFAAVKPFLSSTIRCFLPSINLHRQPSYSIL